MILKNNEKFKMYMKIIIFLIYFIFLEIAKIVTARTSANLSCNNGYQFESNSTSLTPLLVGIIVLASTAFIIILMTFYAHRLEMRQKSRTEPKENVRTCLL